MSIAHSHATPGGYVGPRRQRSEVLGFLVHMAEGTNVSGYLSRKPARGVSVQYTVEQKDRAGHFDGQIVSMVPELVIAGSINPGALRDDDGAYYGRSHLDYVLGQRGARNPNHYVIAVEVAGTARKGPTDAQIASLVRLFKDCRKRYPGIKPLGHRDQMDLKLCPGTTDAMKGAFALMGGHGRDYRLTPRPEAHPIVSTIAYVPNQVAQLRANAKLYAALGDKAFATVSGPTLRPTFGTSPDGKYRLVAADSPSDAGDALDRTAWVAVDDVLSLAIQPPTTVPDAATRAKALSEAEAAVKALPR